MTELLGDEVREARRDIADVRRDVRKLNETKAEHEDMRALAGKLDAIETETRKKYGALDAGLNDVLEEAKRLTARLEQMARDLDGLGASLARAKAAQPPPGSMAAGSSSAAQPPSASSPWWSTAPRWALVLMALGAGVLLSGLMQFGDSTLKALAARAIGGDF